MAADQDHDTRGIAYIARNRPGFINTVLVVVVAAHAVVANAWLPRVWPGRALSKTELAGDASVLFLGAATVAAMVAGFAGVVVVFALSSESMRFRRMRVEGDERLRSNWTSVVATSFVAAGLSVVAAFMRLTGADGWIWVFEVAAAYLLHAALRLIWLLRRLAAAVAGEDSEQQEEDERAPVDTVVRPHHRRTA